jgi:hypothetical protein
MRAAWTPLFSLVRHDQREPGEVRTSVLWDAITWEHRKSDGATEFHLGPLLSVVRDSRGQRIALGRGLVGIGRGPGDQAWHGFLFDFKAKPARENLSARLP